MGNATSQPAEHEQILFGGGQVGSSTSHKTRLVANLSTLEAGTGQLETVICIQKPCYSVFMLGYPFPLIGGHLTAVG